MPIGIVSDDLFEKELEDSKGRTMPTHVDDPMGLGVVIPIPVKGRKDGDKNVPDSLRELIGVDAIENGRGEALALAESLGISSSSVSAYSNGSHSTSSYKDKNPALFGKLQKSRLRIANKAKRTLHAALDSITPDKLEGIKVVEAAMIARQMSSIVKEMEPDLSEDREDKDGLKAPQIIIYAPKVVSESIFPIMTVNE